MARYCKKSSQKRLNWCQNRQDVLVWSRKALPFVRSLSPRKLDIGDEFGLCLGSVGHDLFSRSFSLLQDLLLALAKAVANATASLVLKAKGVASKCENQEDQNKVIGTATQCALATSQLVACTKVFHSELSITVCQIELCMVRWRFICRCVLMWLDFLPV